MENGQDVLKMNLPKSNLFGACRLNCSKLKGMSQGLLRVHGNFSSNEH